MTYSLRASPIFWDNVDAVHGDKDLLRAIYDALFALSTDGDTAPGIMLFPIPVPPIMFDGGTIELANGDGFITFIKPSDDRYYALRMTLYHWDDDDDY